MTMPKRPRRKKKTDTAAQGSGKSSVENKGKDVWRGHDGYM